MELCVLKFKSGEMEDGEVPLLGNIVWIGQNFLFLLMKEVKKI